jgi:hypothetical protein
VKLRKIEKRYLFKATIPDVLVNLNESLQQLNAAIANPVGSKAAIVAVLNFLLVDVKNVKGKATGDSLEVAKQLLDLIQTTQLSSANPANSALLDIYGKGMGLVRSLENDQADQDWGRR